MSLCEKGVSNEKFGTVVKKPSKAGISAILDAASWRNDNISIRIMLHLKLLKSLKKIIEITKRDITSDRNIDNYINSNKQDSVTNNNFQTLKKSDLILGKCALYAISLEQKNERINTNKHRYRGNNQAVVIDDDGSRVISHFPNLNTGVPHGYILGPPLFSLYLSDISNIVTSCQGH